MPKSNHNKAKKRTSTMEFTVKEQTELLPFLLSVMDNRSRNSVKSILTRGQVTVDDHMETKHNYPLRKGQQVTVLKNKVAKTQEVLIGMEIIFEDDDIIVINKEAGLLSIASAKEKRQTAHHQLMDYVKREDPAGRIFVVHRLDKDTSGVMVFAKNEHAKYQLQENWKKNVMERKYLAFVEGKVREKQGKVTSWLRETTTHLMYSSQTKDDGLYAETHYKLLQQNADYSLLEVELETGRKNQIRVHMQDLGHPVVGDKKYGSKQRKTLGRLGLHAKVLSFRHPVTNKVLMFQTDAPDSFYKKSK